MLYILSSHVSIYPNMNGIIKMTLINKMVSPIQ